VQVVALKQGLVCAAIGVGGHRLEQESLIAIAGIETNGNARSGFAASGVEDVSGETAHSIS